MCGSELGGTECPEKLASSIQMNYEQFSQNLEFCPVYSEKPGLDLMLINVLCSVHRST